MLARASKRRMAVVRLILAAGAVPLLTCAASPPVQPSPVVVNVKQTAIGINVCHSGCVQNVHVQNISVVVVNQGAARPVSRAAPQPPPAVKTPARPVVTGTRKVTPRPAPPPPPAQEPPQQTGAPAADPPEAQPSQSSDPEALAPRDIHSRPLKRKVAPASGGAGAPLNLAPPDEARAAAFTRPVPAAAIPRPSLTTPWIPVLAVVVVLWTSLFFVRRPAPASGLLVLDDGPVS